MAAHQRDDQSGRRLHTLVGLVLLIGAVTVVSAAVHIMVTGTTPRPWVVPGVVVALTTVAALLNVDVRIRSTRHGVSWADAAILVAVAVLPLGQAVLATAAAILIAEIIRRRPPLKLFFAVAKESTTAFVGALTLTLVGGSGTMPAVDLAGLVLAFIVMTLIDETLAMPVLAAASGTPVRDRLRTDADIRLLTAGGRMIVAVAAVLVIQLQPVLLYTLPLLVLVAHLWHERWIRMREERQAWQRLAATTESFGVDLTELLNAAVIGGAHLFSADELEIEAWPRGGRRLMRGNTEQAAEIDPAQALRQGARVHTVPLSGHPGSADIGAVRLRFRAQVQMSEREQAMLSSFAASLDTAIRNAEAYQQLGEATQAHAYAAAHDPLTGLANRRELQRQLSEALSGPQGSACQIAVLMIDLRHFKEVNDAFGHQTGDEVLSQVATRLGGAVGRTDLLSRFGGDEFAVLLRQAVRPHQVRRRAEHILAALADPVVVDRLPLAVEASAGLAIAFDLHPAGSPVDVRQHSAELMRRADVAMYHAKRSARPLVTYHPAADPADPERLSLAGQLPRAVTQREFILHFQPIVEVATGRVTGAEALVRWRHPTQGQLAPGRFLELLERSSQLDAFTAAVLEQALAAADTWRAAGHDLSVSINISPRSLLDPGLPQLVREQLRAHRTPPQRLYLELTETLAISQLEIVDRVLHELYDIGVQLALDDFGTGFSSLAVLSRIPVHQLKVDRGFINALGGALPPAGDGAHPMRHASGAAQATAVVRATVQLGRALGMEVVAEGIETDIQRRTVWELGCLLGQGHRFATAMSSDRLLALLRHHRHVAKPLSGVAAGGHLAQAQVVLLDAARRVTRGGN